MTDPAASTDLQARLAACGERLEPTRRRTLEAVARRLPSLGPQVRRVLEARLEAALAAAAQAPDLPASAPEPPAPPAADPLAGFVASLRDRAAPRGTPAWPGDEAGADELAGARRFRRSWDRLQALQRVDAAVARAPANAGPLNSHALVLRALGRMRDLSPDYLRRFLAHAETLQWLEQAREQVREAARKRKAPARARKAR